MHFDVKIAGLPLEKKEHEVYISPVGQVRVGPERFSILIGKYF